MSAAYARHVYQHAAAGGEVREYAHELLSRAVTFLGSDAESDLWLDAATVAPFHAAITAAPDRISCRDLRTGQPVLLNGQPITCAVLMDGDTLTVGDYVFRVETNLMVAPQRGPLLEPHILSDDSSLGDAPSNSETAVHHKRDHDRQESNKRVASALLGDKRILPYQASWLANETFAPFVVDDRYELRDVLGAGGMGWIYRGVRLEDDSPVAIKVVSASEPKDILSRLELEYQAGEGLEHEHVVRTLEHFCTDEAAYLVLGYVEGLSLDELVRFRGPLPVRQVCDVLAQVADALAYLHGEHKLHRDVKPANLLIDSEGTVTLLDLGLALVDAGEDAAEFSLAMIFGQDCIGTPDYMPPEQVEDSFRVDARADLYALGCTAFALLSGRPPFADFGPSTPEKFAAHEKQPVPWERLESLDLPDELDTLLRALLAKEPQARPDSAAEVSELLQAFAERSSVEFNLDEVIHVRQAEARERLTEMRRHQISAQASAETSVPSVGFFTLSSSDVPPRSEPSEEVTSVSLMPPSTSFPSVMSDGSEKDEELAHLSSCWHRLSPGTREAIMRLIDLGAGDDTMTEGEDFDHESDDDFELA